MTEQLTPALFILKNKIQRTTVLLEKTLESPLDCKEIKAVNPKGNQSWIFIGRADDIVEASIVWPPDAKSWLIRKDRDAGKDWRQEEKGTTENKMAGWHNWLNRHEFEQASGYGEGQGSSACCSPCKKLQKAGHDWATEQQLCYTYGIVVVIQNIVFYERLHIQKFDFVYTVTEKSFLVYCLSFLSKN